MRTYRFSTIARTSACLIASLLFTLPATAQEREKVRLTDQQAELNNKAVLMLKEDPPRAEEAIDITQAALRLGPKGDLLILTLGRAHFLAGQCAEAKEQFDLVKSAPEVEGLPQAFVSVRLDKYRQEMRQGCPGMLDIKCSAPDIVLTMGEESLTCNETIELPAGAYSINAARASTGAKISVQTNVVGMTTTELKIDLGEPTEKAPEKDPEKGPERGPEEPEQEKLSLFRASVLPMGGYCLARVIEDAYNEDDFTEEELRRLNRGEATGASACLGLNLRLEERFALKNNMAVGGELDVDFFTSLAPSENFMETRGTENFTLPSGIHLRLGLRYWLNSAISLELPLRFILDSIEYGTKEEYEAYDKADPEDDSALLRGSGMTLAYVGIGARFELQELVPSAPNIALGARWTPSINGDLNVWDARATYHRKRFIASVGFRRWVGSEQAFNFPAPSDPPLPPGIENKIQTNEHEQLLLGLGFTFGVPH